KVSFLHLKNDYFSNKDFIQDNKSIPWNIADSLIKINLKNCSNEFEKVCVIREFAYSHADWSSSKSNFKIGESSVKEIYDYFEYDQGGGYCGLAARYLSKLYNHYGFKNCIYNMGNTQSEAAHETTIVKIVHNGQVINSIQ